MYLDDPLWKALHARARRQQSDVSELVRQAVRERYLGDREQRRSATQGFVGIRKFSAETEHVTEEVRRLRHGSRGGQIAMARLRTSKMGRSANIHPARILIS